MLLKGHLVYCHLAKGFLGLDQQSFLLGHFLSPDTQILLSSPLFHLRMFFLLPVFLHSDTDCSILGYLAGLNNCEAVEVIFRYCPKGYLKEGGEDLVTALFLTFPPTAFLCVCSITH